MSHTSKYRQGAETHIKQPSTSSTMMLVEMKEGNHDRDQTPASTQVQAHQDGVKALLLLVSIALLGGVTVQWCLPSVRLCYGGATAKGFYSCLCVAGDKVLESFSLVVHTSLI